MTWQSTGVRADSLSPGQLRSIEVNGAEIVLARVGPEIYALTNHCPHRDGELSEGSLDGARLTCPLHGAVFDLRTGAVLADPFGIEPPAGGVDPVPRVPVKLEAGAIWVELP